MGLTAFTCEVYGLIYLPVFVAVIIFNLAPFITAIFGYFINNELVSKITKVCMIGCFSGVIILTVSKKHE